MKNGEIFYKNNAIDGGFLQSEFWEAFQRELGRKAVRISEEDKLEALGINYELPVVGSYVFVPRGPVVNLKDENEKIKIKIEELVDAAKEIGAGWIRLEPQNKDDLKFIKEAVGKKYKITKSKKNHEPAETLTLDLTESEEKLLAQMKQKTRYNIRLAARSGVEIFASNRENDLQMFLQLNKETAERDGIVVHPDGYYKKMLETIPSDKLRLYLAKHGDTVICGAFVSFYGGVATYLHGASSNGQRQLMAPYALQWQMIKDAKAIGCEKYDFGGTKMGDEKGSWAGITRFKVGFAPKNKPIEFPGCWDVVIDGRKYLLYRILQGIKDLIR